MSPALTSVIISTSIATVGGVITAIISARATKSANLANAQATQRANSKTVYINTITAERTKWMGNVREAIAEFACSALYLFSPDCSQKGEVASTIRHMEMYGAKMKMFMNPTGEIEKQISSLVDEIQQDIDTHYESLALSETSAEKTKRECREKIKKLVCSSQEFLKKEWEIIKREAEKGYLD